MAIVPILPSLLQSSSTKTANVEDVTFGDGETPAFEPGQAVLVFDDAIEGSAAAYTGVQWADPLGQYDQLTLHLTVDDQTSGGLIVAQIEHSADGRTWTNKNTYGEISTFWLNNTVPAPGSTGTLWGYDDAVNPSLALVRIRMQTEGIDRVHVKLVVVPREIR